MNQNVSNNNWLKRLSSENLTAERVNTKNTGVESAFSNLLSSHLGKASQKQNNINVGAQTKEIFERKENASSVLKKVEPTANKLAIKTPEKMVTSDKETANTQQNKELSKNEVDQKTLVSKTIGEGKDSNQTDEIKCSESANDSSKVEEDSVKIEDIIEMMQQVLSSLINQLTENPELSNKEQLQDQIQTLSGLIGEISMMKDFKVDVDTVNQLKSALEGIMTAGEDTSLQLEVIDRLKSTIKDIKEKYGKMDTRDFNKLLEQKIADSTTTKVETTSSNETKAVDSNPNRGNLESGQENSKNNLFDDKLAKESQSKTLNAGTEKLDVKINNSESKTTLSNSTVEFNAKLESAAVAFGKTELSNQVIRTPIQQSIMDQLINSPRMQIKQTEQGTMMTMKLNPEVLGDVEIKMEIVKGVLQAEIKVENMIVKGAIEANLSDLKNALSDKGYQVESLNVSVGKDGQDNQGQRQQHQNERQDRIFMDDIELDNGQYGFDSIINDSQIDYRG